MKTTHLKLTVLFLGLQIMKSNAQYITPMGVGNYGAVHSLHLNPSLSGYSAYKWQVNLAGLWVNMNNNYLTLKLPYSAYRTINNNIPLIYQTESGNARFDRLWLTEKLNGRNKQVSVASDVYGPSASVQIKSWRVGLVTSAHAGARIANMPENFAHALNKDLDSSQGAFSLFKTLAQGGANTINEFAVVGHSRIAAGINVAKVIQLDWKRQLILGATVKKNWGMPGFYLHNSGLTLTTVNADSVVFQPAKMQLVTYGDQIGKGMGIDLGATYVFNKRDTKRHGGYKKNQTLYFGKFGVAIMDIGKITYQNAVFNEVVINLPVGINVNSAFRNTIAGSTNYQAMADSFFNKFGTYQTYKGTYAVGLPTRLVLTADFQIKKHLFVAGVLTQSLRRKLSNNARYQSALMVAPRLEYRFFEFSMPVLLQYDYRALRVGSAVRIGPLYFGTNSLMSFAYTKSVRDADFFIGIAFGNLPDFSFKKVWKKRKELLLRSRMGCANSF